MPGEVYVVGQPFPDERYKGSKFGAAIDFRDTTFDVIILIDSPAKEEISAISSGPFSYGLFEKNNIPFMTLEFRGLLFDASFNAHKLKEEFCKRWLESENNAMNIFVVNSDTYRLVAIRTVGFHYEFLHELKKIIPVQLVSFQGMHSVDENIKKITANHTIRDMTRSAKKFRIG